MEDIWLLVMTLSQTFSHLSFPLFQYVNVIIITIVVKE